MYIRILTICALSLKLASSVAAGDHFPLSEGVIYEYEYNLHQGSGIYCTYFSGTANVGGTNTQVLNYAGGVDNGLLNFWTETPEGDKSFHGYRIGSYSQQFSPPILMIDEPLCVGKSWEVNSRDSDSLAVHIRFEVMAFDEVTVPAGTFLAFTIEDTWEYPEGLRVGSVHSYSLGVSEHSRLAQQVFQRTYADGIGLVLSVYGSRADRLRSFRPVAVQPTTWTRVRMLYR